MTRTQLTGKQIKDSSVKFVDISGEGDYLYLVGDASTNGSWRMKATANGNVEFQFRSASLWLTRGVINGV